MKGGSFPWKGVFGTGITLVAVFLGAVNWFYLKDEPVPPTPYWAVPVVRDPEAIAALRGYFALEPPLGELGEEERDRIAAGCLAGTSSAISTDDDAKLREEVTALAFKYGDALEALQQHLESSSRFTYPAAEKYDLSDQAGLLDSDFTLKFLIQMRIQMRHECWSGNLNVGIDSAIDGVNLAHLLLHADGVVAHHLIGITVYNIALQTLYSASWLAKDDPELLRQIISRTVPLRLDSTPFRQAIVGDYWWSQSVTSEITFELLRAAYPEEDDRFFWIAPQLFSKDNQTHRLYQDLYTWFIENSDHPYYLRTSPAPWDQLWEVTEKALVRDLHPNSIGYMQTARTAGVFEVILDRTLRTEFFLECIQTACAVRILELEHGAYPKDLAELIPDYIDQLPVDPQDGELVRFRDGILFGIGEDDIAQGAAWGSPFESADDPALAVPGRKSE
ncbi:MAG: hypothetical protein R3F19_17035 [Verrucomicrobiales bacterium]